jgi:hypothetical protein
MRIKCPKQSKTLFLRLIMTSQSPCWQRGDGSNV